MTNTHINVGGHKITTNKVGEVKDISNKLQTGISVTYFAQYKVVNGICFMSFWGLKGSSTGTLTMINAGDYPEPATAYRSTDTSDAVTIFCDFPYSGSKAMKVTVSTANTNTFHAFSYPVADDWVEN